MARQLFLDGPHATADLLTPILAQHRDWWSRLVFASHNADGEIVLRGSVSSWYHKQLAQEAFRSAQPETRIRNELQVARG